MIKKQVTGPQIPNHNLLIIQSNNQLHQLPGNLTNIKSLNVIGNDSGQVNLAVLHNTIESVLGFDDLFDFGKMFALGVLYDGKTFLL